MSTAKRRKLKKAVIGWLCIAALTANMTIPGAPLHEFTQITANAEFENVTPVNLSDIANCIGKNKIVDGITVTLKDNYGKNYYEIQITKGGDYAFKGSNYINNSYADIQFVVDDGITANLYFDDVYIKNDDGEFISSGSFLYYHIKPFDIGSSSTADLSGKLCIDTYSYFNDNTKLFLKSDLKTGEGTLTGLHTVIYTNESGNQFEEIYCTSGADAKLPEGYECFTVADKAFDGKNVTESVTVKAFENHSFDTNGFCACGEYKPAEKINDVQSPYYGYYAIENAGQLYWFADKVNTDNENFGNENAVLTADITVNKGENTNDVANCNGKKADGWKDWTPIGGYDYDTDVGYPYTGTFDGNGFAVSGLYFNDTSTGSVGLFGLSEGTIKNVGVVDSYFNGYREVGAVCGNNGINCTIINCYNTGSVSGSGWYVGGVCGFNGINCTITNCYNTGKVSGDAYVGGVCGSNVGTITNCYNTGSVSGNDIVDYVCGENNQGVITKCYYLVDKADENGGKTTTQFNGGEVAYLLSQGCTIGEGESAVTYDGSVWGQDLSVSDSYPVLGGKKVLANSNKTKFANDIIINGQNVVLDGTIGFNIYVAADDAYEWSAKIDGKEVPKPEKDENGIYKFTCNVAAKDMSKNIEFYINDNVKATVSVKAYLDALDTADDTKLANLVTAMETYGTAANAFFNGGNVDPVDSVTAENLSGYTFTKNDAPEGISYYGSSLILKSETTVRHYFQLAEGKSIDDFEFTVNDSPVDLKVKETNPGYCYIDIENISADKLGEKHTVTVKAKDSTESPSEVIKDYCALSYANTVLEKSDDENLQNLVKTLYLYNQKANAYSTT